MFLLLAKWKQVEALGEVLSLYPVYFTDSEDLYLMLDWLEKKTKKTPQLKHLNMV